MKKQLLFQLMLCLFCFQVSAQIQVQGTIEDASNGDPLSGASVIEKGTTNGVAADFDGNFAISVSSLNAILQASYVGYASTDFPLSGETNVSIALEPDSQSLDEVVIVGYAEQKKENLTGAVSSVGGEELNQRPVVSAQSALQGIAPGVTVTQNSGAPGSNGTISIRGIGTIGNNDPLIIVDGSPGSFDQVNPNDIESISVLKDAASAAIYGSRAAGGVVIITTKRGKEGRISVSYNGQVGFQTPVDQQNFLGSEDYIRLYNEALENESGSPGTFVAPNPGVNTDWQDETLVKGPIQQQHSITVSGGNEWLRSNASASLQTQDGLLALSDYERQAFRINNDVRASDKLSFQLDLSVTQIEDTSPSWGTNVIFTQINRIPPVYGGINGDGSFGEGWNGTNPIAMSTVGGKDQLLTDIVQLNIGGTWELAKGFNMNFVYSPNIENNNRRRFQREYEYTTFDANGPGPTEVNGPSELTETSSRIKRDNLKVLLTYDLDFGKNNAMNLLGGFESFRFRQQQNSIFRRGFLLPDFQVIDAGDPSSAQISGNIGEWALESYFGRANFNFSDKYLLEANVRYDGSSRFSKDKRWGLFPSFSAGWRLSQEEFFKNDIFTQLKLRASWGQLGNQFATGNLLPYVSLVDISQSIPLGNEIRSGASINTLANTDLTWETTTVLDFGIDATLWGKLNFTGDYYIKDTEDILLLLPIPNSIGLNPAFVNAGKVRNKGVDLGLTLRDNIDGFNYRIGAVYSNVSNEIISLNDGTFITDRQINREGGELGALYGLETDGLLTQAEVDAGLGFGGKPGDIKFVDRNGDDVLDGDDRQVIGSRIPKHTYSLDMGFEYKGFGLDLFFQGVGEVDGYLDRQAAWAFVNTSGKITAEIADNRWTASNPDPNAGYPRLWQNTGNINEQVSDFWVVDASYFKLKNIVLSYSLPEKFLKPIGFSKFRIYLSGQNVLNFDNIKGFDAEAPLGNAGFYPQVSVYAFGTNISF